MNLITRENLTGFRSPTETEKTSIFGYMQKKIARETRPMIFWGVILSVFAVFLLLYLIQGMGNWGTKLIVLLLLIGVIAGVFWIRLCRNQKKALLRKISEGEYEVLDCTAYETSFNVELVGEAPVKICSMDGQYCSEKFLLDLPTAKKCKENSNTRLLLLKCGQDFYELLSDYRMGMNEK